MSKNHKGLTEEAVIAALRKHKSNTATAKSLGCTRVNIIRWRRRLIKKGLWNEEDESHLVPDGYKVKGKSILFDKNGSPIISWVKSDIDAERQEQIMREVIEAMKAEIPKARPSAPAKNINENLCNCFILTDFHLGMKAWHEETGDEDYDIPIASKLLVDWANNAISRCPDAKTGILAQLGDFLHWDGLDAVTPKSKHVLDADTRFPKLVRNSIILTRFVINLMLEKHEEVIVVFTGGNHDPASTIWLRELTSSLYENEPRVKVDMSSDLYFAVEHGLTSLFFHHGHMRRGEKLSSTLVSKFREVFGRTKFSYAHTGHFHNHSSIEDMMIVEQHRTLAPKDAYASHGGWESGRDAKVVTYHKQYGEVSRISVTPEMLS